MLLLAEAQNQGRHATDLAARIGWKAAFLLPIAIAAAWSSLCGLFGRGVAEMSASGAVLTFLLLVSSWTDATRGKIFNWLTYPALLWAFVVNLIGPASGAMGRIASIPTLDGRGIFLGEIGLSQCLLGAFVGFAVMLFLYRLSGGGAGDVKLAAAIGALIGFRGMVETLMFAYVAAGVFAVARGFWTHGPVAVIGGFFRWLASVIAPGLVSPPDESQQRWLKSKIRLAPFFAIGTLASLAGGGLRW